MILNPDAMRFTCQPFTALQSGGPKDTTMWIRLACTYVHPIHSSLYLLWVRRTHLWKRFPGLCAPVGKKSTKGNYWEHLPFRFESTDSDMSWNTRIDWQLVDLSPFARFRVFHLDQQQLTHQMKHSLVVGFPWMVPSSRILTNKRTRQHVNVSDVTWGAGKMPWCQPAKMLLSYFPGHTSQIIYLRKFHTKSKSIYNLYIHLVKWSKMSSKSPSTNTRIRSQLHGKAKRTNGQGFIPHISTLNSVSKLISIHFPT